MTNLISNTLAVAACAGLMLSAAAHAEAPQAGEKFAANFAYNAKELQTEEGAAKLLSRLERAVRAECETGQGRSMHERQLTRQCIDKTMQTTITKFGSSSLAAAYAESRG